MIRAYEEVLDQEWTDRNINNPDHELVVLRQISTSSYILYHFE